jgi:hypothetical protein
MSHLNIHQLARLRHQQTLSDPYHAAVLYQILYVRHEKRCPTAYVHRYCSLQTRSNLQHPHFSKLH